MRVLMFMPKFHELVRSGVKTQTLRPTPKRLIKPGDDLSLRGWRDKPYRSKQFELTKAVCRSVENLEICFVKDEWRIYARLGGSWLAESVMEAWARSDGFSSLREMTDFWLDVHDVDLKPFFGILIKWLPIVSPETADG